MKGSPLLKPPFCKPVLNGLSDLLRLPQYPVLGVRAAALTGVRREGELYTRLHAGGKRRAAPAQDGHKLGNSSYLSLFLHCGRAPADSRGPTGKFSLHAKTRTSHAAHVAGFGPPHARAPRLASQRGRPHGRRSLLMYRGPRSPSPPPSPCGLAEPLRIYREPGPGRRAGDTGCRARPLPNARRAISRPAMAKTATRPIRQASLPAVLRPSGLPSPAQKSPHPKVNLRRGLKKRAQVLICILSVN